MDEARMEQTGHGLVPADDGWWVANVRDLAWHTVEGGGTWCEFESPRTPRGPLGIGVHVLPAGETPGFYHWESDTEGFFVLEGECLLVVEGQERVMRRWDYFHCPAGTAHITIGASEEPCAILMVGTRSADHHTRYLADPVAARHGAAVPVETDSPREAYANRPPFHPAHAPWPRDR
ncbi:MAG: cupin domain-containing protein [Solirubrobacterales bacterium]|nr:cupin domain-containing protein [Solirubrobacterales bacterium]